MRLTAPMPTPPPTGTPGSRNPHSDVAGLDADYQEIMGIMHQARQPINTPNENDGDRVAVIGDNFLSCMNLAAALGLLIDHRNHEGAVVALRALYETCVNLIYLYDVGDRTHNALLARGYALQEIAENYAAAGAQEVAKEHRRLFETMPTALRRELAENRKRERNHWSGASLAKRAERIGIVGHRIMYRGTSWEAHALALGRLTLTPKGPDSFVITLHRALSDKDAEGLARLARIVLREAWARFAAEFLGRVVRLSAPPPDAKATTLQTEGGA